MQITNINSLRQSIAAKQQLEIITAEFSQHAADYLNQRGLSGADSVHARERIHFFDILEAMREAMPPDAERVTLVRQPDGQVRVEVGA